ncbi:winged helix-turn-helix domain-containing protein [Frankia sp. Ag45/Mut15]|uniref:Winged helix-turn-helix domain-containing protein n=1 Tax=Frankia umida TaxID=573489 RepID=A0ABT0JWM5_9ACTN|nr:response regulator transcription factor [Frankia umida]MCK9875956.1 winged helix-turn-helix domain-containing protein [Frankia umida]
MRTTLLLVGDEAAARRELLTTLVDEGYGVDTARSADHALAVLASRSVDLVLSCLPLGTEPGALPLPDDLAALDDPWFDRPVWPGETSRPPAREQLPPPERAALAAERLDTLVYGPAGPPPVSFPAPAPAPTATATPTPTSARTSEQAPGPAVEPELAPMSGLEFCRQVRAGGDVALVVVADRADPQGIVAGLEAGADDFITAPPLSAEALARLRALLRRTRPAGQGPGRAFSVGELQIRPAEGVVRRHGEDQALTRTEFRLLCELAVAGGQAVSRRQLMERIWGYDYFGGARMLDVHVRRLRRKVEVDPSAPTHILTVRGIGYRVCAPSGGD